MYSIVTDNQAIKNINDLKLHFRVVKLVKVVETHRDWAIAWMSIYKAMCFISHTLSLNLMNIMTTSHHTLHQSLQELTKKPLTSIKLSESTSDLSKMCLSMTSASSAISKLATFKVMALAKAGVSTKEKGKQKDSSDRLEERRPLPSVE